MLEYVKDYKSFFVEAIAKDKGISLVEAELIEFLPFISEFEAIV